MKTGHIFAGAGGGLLADLILGHEPIEAVERNEKICRDLASRTAWFPSLRVHCADVHGFDATDWQGRVDILHAGIPCPRWSAARRGRGGTYDGLADTLRVVSQCRPPIVFLECVAGFAREHQRVESGFREIKYGVTRALVLDASSLGAPHSRPRYWALGYSYDEGESMLRDDAEVAFLPPIDAGLWWETDAREIRMADGVAPRVHRYGQIGNGQVPLQAAAAYLMLGGPTSSVSAPVPEEPKNG